MSVVVTALVGIGDPASAATATVVIYEENPDGPDRLLVMAAPGQANSLSIKAFEIDTFQISDGAGAMTSSPECAQVSATEVRCPAADLGELLVNSGDEPDTVAMTYGDGDNGVNFFPGVIRIETGPDDDQVVLGVKYFHVELIDAVIAIKVGAGNDQVVLGYSSVDHELTTIGQIRVGLGPGADAATLVNELDLEASIDGGEGPDHIELAGPGMARGDGGPDRLIGGAGNQHLFGEDADDHLACGDGGEDFAHGGLGVDSAEADCEKQVATE